MDTATCHYLLYDGTCEFCQRWANWVRNPDRAGRFCVVPWQDAPSPPMTPALQIQARQAVQLITREGCHLQGGRAVLFTLQETGWCPLVTRLLRRRPCIWGVELGYRIVAAHRSRLIRFVPR